MVFWGLNPAGASLPGFLFCTITPYIHRLFAAPMPGMCHPHKRVCCLPQLWGMANKNTLLWVALGAGVVWYFFRQTTRIDVGNAGVSSVKLRNGAVNIEISLPILNRSDLNYTVQGFLGTLLYKDTPVGNITMPQAVKIPSRGQAAPKFLASIRLADLSGPVLQLLQQTGVTKWLGDLIGIDLGGSAANPSALMAWNQFSIRGTLYVDNLKVDINQSLA